MEGGEMSEGPQMVSEVQSSMRSTREVAGISAAAEKPVISPASSLENQAPQQPILQTENKDKIPVVENQSLLNSSVSGEASVSLLSENHDKNEAGDAEIQQSQTIEQGNGEGSLSSSENSSDINVEELFGSDVVEHVDKEKVRAIAEKIGKFYGLPQSMIDRGAESEIYVIKGDRFNKELVEQQRGAFTEEERKKYSEIMSSNEFTDENLVQALDNLIMEHKESIKKNAGEREEIAKSDASAVGGIAFPREKNSVILVKENGPLGREDVEDHEMCHIMSSDNEGRYEGFNARWDRLTGLYPNQRLTEAFTQVAASMASHPELSVPQMASKIAKGEIEVGYAPDVIKVLLMIGAAGQDKEQPFTMRDAANIYFHNFEGEGDAADLFKQKIIERVSPRLGDKFMPWLTTDLKG